MSGNVSPNSAKDELNILTGELKSPQLPEIKQPLADLLADSVSVSLEGQLITLNASEVLTPAARLEWKPFYDR